MVPYVIVHCDNGILYKVLSNRLKPVDEDDIITIPHSSKQLLKRFISMNVDYIRTLLDSLPPLSLLQGFMSVHDRSGHLSFGILFQMIDTSILPKNLFST